MYIYTHKMLKWYFYNVFNVKIILICFILLLKTKLILYYINFITHKCNNIWIKTNSVLLLDTVTASRAHSLLFFTLLFLPPFFSYLHMAGCVLTEELDGIHFQLSGSCRSDISLPASKKKPSGSGVNKKMKWLFLTQPLVKKVALSGY